MLFRLEAARLFDHSAHLRLTFRGAGRLGWIAPRFAEVFEDYTDTVAREGADVAILSPDRLQAAIRDLHTRGWISGWRNESYDVRAPGGRVLFTLERAAFRPLGLQASAAHLNGWVRDGNGWRLWVARRSVTKPIDPGMLDNLVGGGIGAGFSATDTLHKECGEEAGLTPILAQGAAPAGCLHILREVPEGVHAETIHAFDLELPADFVPSNTDGEVSDFALLSAAEVESRLAAGEFTVDAGAVTIDFLWRRGALRDPRVGAALETLRRDAHMGAEEPG